MNEEKPFRGRMQEFRTPPSLAQAELTANRARALLSPEERIRRQRLMDAILDLAVPDIIRINNAARAAKSATVDISADIPQASEVITPAPEVTTQQPETSLQPHKLSITDILPADFHTIHGNKGYLGLEDAMYWVNLVQSTARDHGLAPLEQNPDLEKFVKTAFRDEATLQGLDHNRLYGDVTTAFRQAPEICSEFAMERVTPLPE